MSALQAEELTKAFGGNQAVADVSLSLERGERVALVGPNGAGKSTVLNLITGHYDTDRGAVSVNGTDVTRLPPSHPKRRPLIRSYQDAGIFGRMTALENVMIPALARGKSRPAAAKRSAELLEQLGLNAVAQTRADKLSGGQRKLLDYARTLTVDAAACLLDEPTAGVHPMLVETITHSIDEQASRGIAFLIVTHDLPWAFSFCNRVIVIAGGRTLVEGDPRTIRADPRVREAYLADPRQAAVSG